MSTNVPEDVTLKRLTSKVNNTLELTDVLNGKKELGGRIGQRQKNKASAEKSVTKGEKLRNQRFKEFDAFIDRIEYLTNEYTGIDVEIKRTLFVRENKPDEIL
ncbi:MAG: hypothetical protein C6Y22_22200 [Hapalosiphonaceae cyanobacterium JJU2]|nr:MAG: hypothetical protein C6Y22_22200 [Hapalosiphonaceae cyanobacterium JJU2]